MSNTSKTCFYGGLLAITLIGGADYITGAIGRELDNVEHTYYSSAAAIISVPLFIEQLDKHIWTKEWQMSLRKIIEIKNEVREAILEGKHNPWGLALRGTKRISSLCYLLAK